MAPPIRITRAEYEAKFGAAPEASVAPTPIPITRAEFEQKFGGQIVPGEPNWQAAGETWTGGMVDLLDNLTFGFGDEIVGAGNAFLDDMTAGFGNTLGGQELQPGSYDARLEEARSLMEGYREDNPIASKANIAAAFLLPFKSGVAGRSTMAGRALQAGAEGGGLGALYGFGSGEGGAYERAKSAAVLGGAGLVLGAAASPVVDMTSAGLRMAADKAAQYGITPGEFIDDLAKALFSSSPQAQRGSVGFGAADDVVRYTPEEVYLARQLRDTPQDVIERGAREIDEAVKRGDPLFLPEAVDSAKMQRNARFIANNDASMDFSQRAIEARTDATMTRASNLFATVSPEADRFTGAAQLQRAASDIIEAAEKKRTELTRPLYNEAYRTNPTIDAPELQQLIQKDKILSGAIKNIKQTAKHADDPDNATKILVKARKRLWEKANDLKAKGFLSEADDILETHKTLNSIMKGESPLLAAADTAYEAASGNISQLTETYLSDLAKLTPDKIEGFSRLFSLPPGRISELRQTFIKSGKGAEWDAGVRAYLQKAAEKSREGQNYTTKVIGDPDLRIRLKAALGDGSEEVIERLQLEDRMFKGKNKYHAGSSTAGNLQEGREFLKDAGTMRKLLNRDFKGALEDVFFGKDIPDELAQRMAEIYFDPKRGAEAINKVVPLLEQYGANRQMAQAFADLADTAITRGGAAGISGAERRTTQTPAQKSQLSQSTGAQPTPLGTQARPPAASASGLDSRQGTSPSGKPKLDPISSDDDSLYTDLFSTANLRGGGVNEEEFRQFESKVVDIANDLGASPADLMAVMRFETGGTLNPAEKNRAGSGATGLIQFMPATAKSLTGAESREAAIKLMESMTPVEQLDYVKKYLKPFKGRLKSLEDVYMAVLWPRAVGKDNEYALFEKGTKAYWQNRGLDINKDGKITKAEATEKVRRFNRVDDDLVDV